MSIHGLGSSAFLPIAKAQRLNPDITKITDMVLERLETGTVEEAIGIIGLIELNTKCHIRILNYLSAKDRYEDALRIFMRIHNKEQKDLQLKNLAYFAVDMDRHPLIDSIFLYISDENKDHFAYEMAIAYLNHYRLGRALHYLLLIVKESRRDNLVLIILKRCNTNIERGIFIFYLCDVFTKKFNVDALIRLKELMPAIDFNCAYHDAGHYFLDHSYLGLTESLILHMTSHEKDIIQQRFNLIRSNQDACGPA